MAEMPQSLTPKEEEEVETPEETPATPETSSEGQEETETPETTPAGEEPKPEGDEPTYKKRYADSSREAQRLRKENEDLRAKIAEQANRPNPVIETPSDEELSKSIPDWDMMSPTEQRLQKEQVTLKRELSSIKGTLNKNSGQLEWEHDFTD